MKKESSPGVFEQTGDGSLHGQAFGLAHLVHSSISTHELPIISYPGLQIHCGNPLIGTQDAFTSQTWTSLHGSYAFPA